MAVRVLDQAEIDVRLTRLQPDWSGTPDGLSRSIEFTDFMTAVGFVTALAPRCEELDLNRPGFHAVFVLAASPVGEPVW